MLPTRATLDDMNAVCGYLISKPTGATPVETRAVVDKKHLDTRKVNALKFWGVVEEVEGKLKITESGRQFMKDGGASKSEVLRNVLIGVKPYQAVVERVVHREESALTAPEVGAHWYEHFKSDVSNSDQLLNEQALCFFQIAQGADLGVFKIGRKGLPTRFEFDAAAARAFVGAPNIGQEQDRLGLNVDEEAAHDVQDEAPPEETPHQTGSVRGNRVFVTHGKNLKILNQIKQIVTFGKFDPVVAMEHETLAKPVPKKVMDEMRTCDAAVINVSADRILLDSGGNEVQMINENVLIEIGAAMALYGDRFILLVEEGVELPSNLQGLYECRYQGSELDMPATMKLLEAFNEFSNG